MDPLWLQTSLPATSEPAPSRAAHGVVGLLLVAVSVAALARSLPADSEPATVARPRVEPAPAAARLGQGRAIDLNQAGPGDLELLPGIGPRLAQRIVAHRERAGAFESVARLADVRGIGPRTLQRLKPLVCIEPCAAEGHDAGIATAAQRSSMKTVDKTAAK